MPCSCKTSINSDSTPVSKDNLSAKALICLTDFVSIALSKLTTAPGTSKVPALISTLAGAGIILNVLVVLQAVAKTISEKAIKKIFFIYDYLVFVNIIKR